MFNSTLVLRMIHVDSLPRLFGVDGNAYIIVVVVAVVVLQRRACNSTHAWNIESGAGGLFGFVQRNGRGKSVAFALVFLRS